MRAITHFLWESAKDTISYPAAIRTVRGNRATPDDIHLSAAVDWLLRSIRVNGGRGSSAAYRFLSGWLAPYPETTGYIIKTLLNLRPRDPEIPFLEIAQNQGDWLIEIQHPTGGICGLHAGMMDKPVVFNTGMVVLGWNALFLETRNERYLKAAKKAGSFLMQSQDDNGCFIKNTSNGMIHTYNARTAWALVQLGTICGDSEFVDAGHKNLDWVLTQQLPNGYFSNNSFKPGKPANTHGLAYVLRGILESYEISRRPEYISAVVRTSSKLVSIYGTSQRIATNFDENWKPLSFHNCLTGYCQIAIVMLKLFRTTGDVRLLNLALHLVDDVKVHQYTKDREADHYGAIKGSFPVYGSYAPLQYPNWATKFFIDALLLKQDIMDDYEDRILHKLSSRRPC